MSLNTTNFGPRASVTTQGAGISNDPGLGGFQVSAPFILDGANLQTANAGAAVLGAGRLSIVSHSGNSVVLAWDSGTSVFTFTNATAE
jgi:hypothetical protein